MKIVPARIPRIIHQTWKTDCVPEEWRMSQKNWSRMKQFGFEYKLWTDEMNEALVRKKYPWFLETYLGFPHNIQRADAIRYFILYEFGGIYSDLDISPKKSFIKLFKMYENRGVALARTNSTMLYSPNLYTNALMMSAKKHPFWPFVWRYMCSRKKSAVDKVCRHFYILNSTGPSMLCVAVGRFRKLHGSDAVTGIPSALVQPGKEWSTRPFSTPEAAVTLLDGGSWHAWDSRLFVKVNKAFDCRDQWFLPVMVVFMVLSLTLAVLLRRCRSRCPTGG